MTPFGMTASDLFASPWLCAGLTALAWGIAMLLAAWSVSKDLTRRQQAGVTRALPTNPVDIIRNAGEA